MQSVPEHSILLGDFNYPSIDWNSLSSDTFERQFLETCNDRFLSQHVSFPTHRSGNTLDLLLSTDENVIGNVTDCGPLGKADHSMVFAEVILPQDNNDSTETIPDYSKADYGKMRELLTEVDWYEELQGMGTVDSWNTFKEKLNKLVDDCVPRKKRRVGDAKPLWMQRNILRLIRKK